MNRCLHLTIHENAATLPRRGAAADLSGRASSDPGSNHIIAPVDDPGSNHIIAPVDDPGSNHIIAPVDDPGSDHVMRRLDDSSSSSFLSGGSGGCGEAVATACSCCCVPGGQDTAPGRTMPNPFIGPRDYSGFVIVRMAPGIENSTARSLWQLANELKLAGLKTVLEIPREAETVGRRRWGGERTRLFVSRPLVELPGLARDDELYQIRLLEQRAATSPFPPLHSLTAYWRLDLRKHPRLVKEVVARLNLLAEVDLAYRELAAGDPMAPAMDGKDFTEDQGYLADAPVGIGAAWARHSLLPPSTFNLCDLEQSWVLDHEDLPGTPPPLLGGDNRVDDEPGSGNHGTAVLGILVATGASSLGVKGVAAGLGSLKVASHYTAKSSGDKFAGTNGHVADTIAQALAQKGSGPLGAGDILLLEVQRGFLPAEVDEADFDAIRLASGLGVIVVEAAGNGGFDLDAYSVPSADRSLHRSDPRFRDSGAILVGAARAGLPHDRAPFSNYGSRLDCFGWGEAVTTCGYGDLLAGKDDKHYYTNSFSGTSSASAIVAGATVLLQSLHETHTGVRLEPQAMREILADLTTGTHQGPNVPGNIGVMPDLKAIVRDRLLLVPDVYLRRSIGDDGAPPAPEDEISSSPDILVSSQTSVRSLFGAGSPGENLPAPGETVVPGGDIYLRLRNRGLGAGTVHVHLFASPAATLITPERWLPVNPPGLDIPSIPQGDALFVADPIPWKLPTSGAITPPPQAWSLLAILSEPEEPPSQPYFDGTGGMPPGPPYFDWAEYRAFLRGPGVAWRNTHRVVSTPKPPALTFWIAGTPDRARHFDFEVIQHLPAGATVTLQVPPALAAKLHQRQPWLGGGTKQLPKRPRTAIRGVELAAGTYADATFTVGGTALTAGHSLAIRQLWRGEEVGRITWLFE